MLNQLRRSLWSFFPFQPILTIPQKKGRLRRQSRNGIYRWNGSSTCLGSMRAGPLGKKRILNNLYVRLTYPGEKVIPIFRIKPNRRFIFWQGPSYWASLHKGASFCMSWLTYWQCNKIRGQWNEIEIPSERYCSFLSHPWNRFWVSLDRSNDQKGLAKITAFVR